MATSVPFANVPTIDISPLYGNNIEAKKSVAQKISEACRDSGFFYASHHGVDVKKLQDVTNEFHRTMTDDEKREIAIHAYNPENEHVRNGYYMAIKDKKAVESYCYLNPSFTDTHPMIKANTPCHEVNIWPNEAKHLNFREFNEGYYWDMFKLSSALLRGFALALGQPEDFFDAHFTQHGTLSAVSLIRYPFIDPYPPAAIRTASDGTLLSFENHLDVSLITVLFQSAVQNLQVETPQGYLNIHASPENYLINCGTYMAHLTHNYFPAPRHRVLYVNKERLSLPFFVNLDHESAIKPFFPHQASLETQNEPIPYGAYLQKELRVLIVKNGQT